MTSINPSFSISIYNMKKEAIYMTKSPEQKNVQSSDTKIQYRLSLKEREDFFKEERETNLQKFTYTFCMRKQKK